MDCRNIENVIIDYIDGVLNIDMQQEVEEHLTACENCRELFEQNKQLMQDIQETEDEMPDIKLKDDFYAMLKKEKAILKKEQGKMVTMKTNNLWIGLKYAATILVIFSVGMFLGKNLQWKSSTTEVAQLQQEVYQMQQNYSLATLSQPTASQRIKAIDMIHEKMQLDKSVLEALIHTLNHDENTNVKMSAVNALSRYADNDRVKDAFIEALKTQDDPILQITLIHTLISIEDNRAQKVLKDLIANENINESVKAQAEEGLKTFI